jgi:hypothetical protein
MMEGLCVVAVGSLIGALLAAGYTRVLLGFLETIWSDAGGRGMFRFNVEPATLAGGIAGFVMLMMGVIWMVTRKQSRQGASLRLEAGTEEVKRTPAQGWPWWAFGLAVTGAGAMACSGLLGAPGAFFLAGFMFLLAGLAAYRWMLRRKTAARWLWEVWRAVCFSSFRWRLSENTAATNGGSVIAVPEDSLSGRKRRVRWMT